MFKNFRAEKNRVESKMVHNTITESYQTRWPGLTIDLPNQNSFEMEVCVWGGGATWETIFKTQNKNKRKPP